MAKTKYIFVTGGVLSGLGKGVSAASIGRVLKFRGYKIFLQKFDPYLNVDPGTMSPFQHGEVYVTHDGGETDLDLGHYERFTGTKTTKLSNYTSGKILYNILKAERKGKYAGKTVQVIPHVTNYIEKLFTKASKTEEFDFVISEIGGTVGDIESQPFIHALTSFSFKNPRDVCVIHVTYVPYLAASNEHKSKPTQNSIKELRSYGVSPSIVLLRSGKKINSEIVRKISQSSMIDKKNIFPVPNSRNIYEIPLFFEAKKLGNRILEHFDIRDERKPDTLAWETFISKMSSKKIHFMNIAFIGKYVDFTDAYMSIIESLKISCAYEDTELKINWYSSDEMGDEKIENIIRENDGAIVLPGFGYRGFEGKTRIVHALRNENIPTLGICYGMQAMIIDQARRVGISKPISTEHGHDGTPIIDIINEDIQDIGGTLRLGEYTSILKEGSLIRSIYGTDAIKERHRHRYEVNPKFKNKIEDDDFIFSGECEERGLVEICELKNHPFFIGVQYHPEFYAHALKPSPLFNSFLRAIIKNKVI